MYRTERFLAGQLRRWIRTVGEAERRDKRFDDVLKNYRLPDGRIIPRNTAEREMYAIFKDVKAFVTTYRSKSQAPFGVGQAIAERCKMTLNGVKKSYLTSV